MIHKHICWAALCVGAFVLGGCEESDQGQTGQGDNGASGNVQVVKNWDCPTQDSPLPAIAPPSMENGEYQWLNFQIQTIEAKGDTVVFQGLRHQFIFCEGNDQWVINTEEFQPDRNDMITDFTNPPYESLTWNGDNYKYRVLLDPNPFPNFAQQAQRVVLELITPDRQEPQLYTLYTLEDMQSANAGSELGFPFVDATALYGDRFYVAISPEQGEGNGGLATIVSYDLAQGGIDIIQPAAINNQQFNDLVVTGDPENPTLWLATQQQGEGNPYLPGMGLVQVSDPFGEGPQVVSFHPRNSPLVGSVPNRLAVIGDRLWVASGDGMCGLPWAQGDDFSGWDCWQIQLQGELPTAGLPLYDRLRAETPATTLSTSQAGSTVDVLWWSPLEKGMGEGRFEVRSPLGFTATLTEQGAMAWTEWYGDDYEPASWQPPIMWPGDQWHWRGDRFVRGFDDISLNYFGGGPQGLSYPNGVENFNQFDWLSMRSDLELVNLNAQVTEVKYYGGWVDDSLIQPYLTVQPQERPKEVKPNPLKAIAPNF